MGIIVFKPTELLKSKYTRRTGGPRNYKYEYGDKKGSTKTQGMAEFTPFMLKRLKSEYAHIKTIDPVQPTYHKMTRMLDSLDQPHLKQIAEADINFLSMLARNRLKKSFQKSKYIRRWRNKYGDWEYEYAKPVYGGSKLDVAKTMQETAKQFVNKVPEPVKINAPIRKRLNSAVQEAVPENYYEFIPFDAINNALKSEGYVIIQEDNTEWSGMLLGSDSDEFFSIGDLSTKRMVHGKPTYGEVTNSGLRMTWYEMSSGRYEIVKYIT